MNRVLAQAAGAILPPVAAAAWWEIAPDAAVEHRLPVLAVTLAAGFGVFFASTREARHLAPRLGLFVAVLVVCAAEAWFGIGRGIADGRLTPGTLARWFAWKTATWQQTFLLLAPPLGILLAAIMIVELALTGAAARWGTAQERRRSRSTLYGRARLMGQADRRQLARGAGLLLGQATRRPRSPLIAWPLEGSAITLAPPRTGKGATIALNLLSPGGRGPRGSTIVIDPRGESYCIAARRRRDMGRNVLLVDPFGVVEAHAASFGDDLDLGHTTSECYNPLDFIRTESDAEAVRDIGVLLDALLTPPRSDNQNTSQHFYESAREIIGGFIAWVRFKEERCNLERVRELLAMTADELTVFRDRVAAEAPFCGGMSLKAVDRRLSVGPEEAGSQASTVANQLAFLSQPSLLGNSARSTFDPAVVSQGDTDLFIVVPDDMIDQVRGWLRLWVTIPNAIPVRRNLDMDLLLIIDEMPRLGFLKPVMDAYNLAAGKGVHFWCFAQSVSALDSTWGREARKTLIDLAEVVQVLGFPRTDTAGAEELAKAIGHATFESSSQSRSGTVSEQRLLMASSQIQAGESTQLVREYLVQPDQLMTMSPDEQYVIAAGKTVSRDALHLHHARYWTRPDCRTLADPNPFVVRKRTGGLAAPAPTPMERILAALGATHRRSTP